MLGNADWQVSVKKAGEFDCTEFEGGDTIFNPAGAMLCVWCDNGAADGLDEGAGVAEKIADVIKAFGSTLPEVRNMEPLVDETYFPDAALRQALSQESYRAMEPEVLGPAPAPVVKLNNRYRYRITVVGQNEKPLRQLLAAYMKAFARRPEHRNMAVHTDCNLMD